MKNFINPKTKEEFFIPRFRTKILEGKVFYFDSYGFELKDNGTRLEKLGSIKKQAVFTDEKKRI